VPDNNTIVPGGGATPSPYGRPVSGNAPPPPPAESYQAGTGFTVDGAVTQLRNYASSQKGQQTLKAVGLNLLFPGAGLVYQMTQNAKAAQPPVAPGPPAQAGSPPAPDALAGLQQNVRGSFQRGLRHLADSLGGPATPAAPPPPPLAPAPPAPPQAVPEEWRIGG
jgi:hypothetical protein